MISAYHCLNQECLVPCVPFCFLSFPWNILHTFLECLVICLVRHGLCLVCFLIKKVSYLLSHGSLTTMFANMLESPHKSYFTVFIKLKILGLFSHIFSSLTLCTYFRTFFIRVCQDSIAPLNISVVLFFILPIAISYVLGISFIVLVLLVIEEDWFTILLNTVTAWMCSSEW